MIEEARFETLQDYLRQGGTARRLVEIYLERIATFDRRGPSINSLLETNPDALTIADRLDEERRRGQIRGLLHGIPIVLKDNIATADRLNTTAGSQLLFGTRVARDATVVERLRAAGAIVLGKTVMNEFASGDAPASRGGMVRNPYALSRTIKGSSSGSAAAVAANFAAAGLGTDTRGSLRYPASDCALVTVRPTAGLISRAGVVPVDFTIDTVGPLARSVTDAAVLLGVLAGPDPRDPLTMRAPRCDKNAYAPGLDADALRGARLGVVHGAVREPIAGAFESSLRVLERLHARLRCGLDVQIEPYGGRDPRGRSLIEAMDLHAIEAYFEALHVDSPIRSLADLAYVTAHWRYPTLVDIATPLQHRSSRSWRRLADDFEAFTRAYDAARDASEQAQRAAIDALFDRHQLDALVLPTTFSPPPPVLETARWPEPHGLSEIASYSGLPEVTVPAGDAGGMPVGLSFLGRAFDEAHLLALAYAFESATHHRRAPVLPDRLPSVRTSVEAME